MSATHAPWHSQRVGMVHVLRTGPSVSSLANDHQRAVLTSLGQTSTGSNSLSRYLVALTMQKTLLATRKHSKTF
jgi:hypothetical protein